MEASVADPLGILPGELTGFCATRIDSPCGSSNLDIGSNKSAAAYPCKIAREPKHSAGRQVNWQIQNLFYIRPDRQLEDTGNSAVYTTINPSHIAFNESESETFSAAPIPWV